MGNLTHPEDSVPYAAVARVRRSSTASSSSPAFIEGPSEPHLLESNINNHFDNVVAHHGSLTAIVSSHQNQRLTYTQLRLRSIAVAENLRKHGVTEYQSVGILMGNTIEHAVLTLALYRLGCAIVPLNPAFKPAQVISALDHVEAEHFILSPETKLPYREPISNFPLLAELLDAVSTPLDPESSTANSESSLSSPPCPLLTRVTVIRSSTEEALSRPTLSSSLLSNVAFEDLATSNTSSPLCFPEFQSGNLAQIQFTSGTTSDPKAAMLSHAHLLNNANSIGSRLGLKPGDLVCCPPPLFHCFGSVLGFLACMKHGATIVFPAPAFDPAATLRAIKDERCVALYGVPTMFAAVLDERAKLPPATRNEGLERLKTGIAAGSSVPAEMMRRLEEDLGLDELRICYGMTETSPVSCMTRRDDPWERRINTVGQPLPHVKVKVVDRHDRHRTLSRGERGELVVNGYLVMKSYWPEADTEKTKEAITTDEEGRRWMHTGDEAEITDDGYVRITGRLKDVIIRGGENIQPLEIENCILERPGVSDVSCVSVPDDKYGEVVAAFIIPTGASGASGHSANDIGAETGPETQLTRHEIRKWVKKKLSSHLVPRYVFFVGSVPKTASGKVQKFALREEAAERVANGEGLA